MNKLTGLLRLMRYELPISAGICVMLGQLFALGKYPGLFLSTSAFASVFLLSASILVLNDYFDVETDKVNAPHRPIPAGLVTPAEAMYFSILLLAAGLAFSGLLGLAAFTISVILTVIGFLYNRFLKKSGLLGNLMVSFSVGMTFVYGGASVGLPFNTIVLFFGMIAALVDLGEEIAADAMDMQGDKLIDSNSVAIRYGKSAALKLSMLIFTLVIILSALPFVFGWFKMIYLLPIILIDFSIAYPALKLYHSKKEEGRIYIRWIYLGATSGLLIFLVMRLSGI